MSRISFFEKHKPICYCSCVLLLPPRIQIDLPVCKIVFGTGQKRYIDHHLCMSFSLRECISRQNWKSVYQGKHRGIYQGRFIILKITKFLFLWIFVTVWGGKRYKTVPSVNHPNQIEGRGNVVHNYGKVKWQHLLNDNT